MFNFESEIYFAGPSGLGNTIALKRKVVCLGHVLAVTVMVLFCAFGFPLESNSAFT